MPFPCISCKMDKFKLRSFEIEKCKFTHDMKIKPSIAINDNGFLFDPNTGESYSANPVAREIIFMMKQDLPFDEIRNRILQRYEVDETTLEKNLIDFQAILRHYYLSEDTDV